MSTQDIQTILGRLDKQDREAAEQRRDIKEMKGTVGRLEIKATETNGRITQLERDGIARKAREEVLKAELDDRTISHRAYQAAAVGACAVGIITLILHAAHV